MSPSQDFCEKDYLYPCVEGAQYHRRSAQPVYWYAQSEFGATIQPFIRYEKGRAKQSGSNDYRIKSEWFNPRKSQKSQSKTTSLPDRCLSRSRIARSVDRLPNRGRITRSVGRLPS